MKVDRLWSSRPIPHCGLKFFDAFATRRGPVFLLPAHLLPAPGLGGVAGGLLPEEGRWAED